MKEFDKKALETAIIYIKRLAEGTNPINNQVIADDSVLNNPNVIRCMYFVREILEDVYANIDKEEVKAPKKKGTAIQTFPEEVLAQFEYREDKAMPSFLNQLYEPVKGQGYKQIAPTAITNRLIANGYIVEIDSEEFKKRIKVPSEKGIAIGMRAERIEYYPGMVVIAIYYDKQAQEFLVANFVKLINGEVLE